MLIGWVGAGDSSQRDISCNDCRRVLEVTVSVQRYGGVVFSKLMAGAEVVVAGKGGTATAADQQVC